MPFKAMGGAEAVHAQPVDVFAPCALGAVVNDKTIGEIRAPVVAGSANNQLAEPRHGHMLWKRNILYAPDYAINAGGVIWVDREGENFDAETATADVMRVGETLTGIFTRARKDGVPPEVAADRIAEERFRIRHEAAA